MLEQVKASKAVTASCIHLFSICRILEVPGNCSGSHLWMGSLVYFATFYCRAGMKEIEQDATEPGGNRPR